MSAAHAPRRRSGTAIVAALALTTLAAALLASAAMVASSGAHAADAARATLAAEGAAQRVLARELTSWGDAMDALPIGGLTQHALALPGEQPALPIAGGVVVRRLDTLLYAISVDVRVGGDVELARRRVRLLVQRAAAPDSAPASARTAPIGRWSMADLY